jgi:uncharacterized lipoprotein YmbA
MPRFIAILFLAIGTLTTLASFGCGGSKPARFYLLQSAPSDQPSMPSGDSSDFTFIGMLPMTMPDYLMRPQIATHMTGNRLDYAEYDRWAEPLLDTMMRVVAADIERGLPGYVVADYPWVANLQIQYRISLEFNRFDLYEDGWAVLEASWAIGQDRHGPWVHIDTIHLTESFEEDKKPDYAARVAALNRLLEKLTQQITEELRLFLQNQPTG